MAGEKLVRIFQQMATNTGQSTDKTDMVFGQVMSTSPLTIQVDSRFLITEEFILLSALCKPKTLTVKMKHGAVGPDATPIEFKIEGDVKLPDTIEVWRGLEVGDNVVMLRVANGQTYYVIERLGDL